MGSAADLIVKARYVISYATFKYPQNLKTRLEAKAHTSCFNILFLRYEYRMYLFLTRMITYASHWIA